MIIDFHTHLGKPERWAIHPELISLEDDIIKAQKEAGIDKSVIFAHPQEPFPEKNLEANMRVFSAKGPFIPFIWINPHFLNEKEIVKLIKKYNVKGIKLHPVFDGYYPTYEFLKETFELSIKMKIPILCHTLWGTMGEVKYIEKLAQDFPKASIVIAHMKESECIEAAKRQDKLYIETSFCPHPRRLEQAVKSIGAEKVLFGSDFPFNDPLIQKMIIKRAKISRKEKNMILGENAVRLLKL